MILGVGLDVVRIDRISHWLDNLSLLARFFHPYEVEALLKKKENPAGSLAARFAAKEAFAKALGTGLRGLALRDIEVKNDDKGRPHIVLYGTARAVFEAIGGRFVHVSLTHERDNALAVVVIEGD
ncbi:holo-ACP synthase [Spirochaetia bacterium 38H-sp]|uniref:Holo-[acyl-carrier-protein] synthase n=1 Tax=Rarispira pelagica TaxID=3141764 RepID=A0ABU9UDP0_9SPIR